MPRLFAVSSYFFVPLPISYDLPMHRRVGPGLVQARALPVRQRHCVELVRCDDYPVRALFERADVISEGAVREEAEGLCYYGTTSLLLVLASQGGLIPDEQQRAIAQQLRFDPHARVRAVRIAHREAQLRCGGTLVRLRADVLVHLDTAGIRFHVEVDGAVVRHATLRRTASPHRKSRA